MNQRETNPEQWAEMYRQIFEVDKRGAAILEHMVQRFSQPASVEGGIDAVLKTYHRMGQHSVVQHILMQLNRANQVPDIQENE
jgi:hypothetical protein